jgi:hypothetical protein
MSLHDGRMTPDFNYTLERSPGDASRLHATETRPRVCEPSGKAQLRSEVSHARTSAQADFPNDMAPSGGNASSGIAGPIRALAVVTGLA